MRETLDQSIPEFIAHSICDGDIWELRHGGPGGSIHELQSPLVVWFLEAIFG